MSVPDRQTLIAAVLAQDDHDLTTKEGAGRFTEAAAAALHSTDQYWGHLLKPANRTHVVGPDGKRHAVDVVLYREAPGRYSTVDLIVDAGEPGAHLGWGVKESDYTDDDWYAPTEKAPDEDEPPADEAALLTALQAITQQQVALLEKMVALERAVANIKPPRPPNYHAEGTIGLPRIFGGNVPFGVTLTPQEPT